LHSLPSKKMLSAEKRLNMHFFRNQGKENWIKDEVHRETAVARKRVQDAETVIMQEQEDM
jgi:hypothetical protein